MQEIPVPDGAASLRTRVIEFSGKFEPVKWECRAPMPNGQLCPRKDRVKVHSWILNNLFLSAAKMTKFYSESSNIFR